MIKLRHFPFYIAFVLVAVSGITKMFMSGASFYQQFFIELAILLAIAALLSLRFKGAFRKRISAITTAIADYIHGNHKQRIDIGEGSDLSELERFINLSLDDLEKQKLLSQQERDYSELIFEATADGIITICENGNIERCNNTAVSLFGYEKMEQLLKEEITKFIPAYNLSSIHNETDAQHQKQQLEGVKANGIHFPVEMTVTPFKQGGKTFLNAVVSDNTEQSRHQRHIQQLAYTDPLTALLNFNGLQRELKAQPDYAEGAKRTIALIGIDGIKNINTCFGFEIGDGYIIGIAQLLKELNLNEPLVARINTDKFVVVASEPAEQVEQVLSGLLHQNMELYFVELQASFCCGIHQISKEIELDDGLQLCELALSRAKQKGKSTQVHVEQIWIDEMRDNARLLHHLDQAIDKSDFHFHFQPKYDVASNSIESVEALIRWKMDGQLISPAVFIPLAERANLMFQIDLWVIETICKTIRQWIDDGVDYYPVSINLSAQHLFNEEVISFLFSKVKEYAIPEGILEIEITEYGLIADFKLAESMFERIYQAGVGIAIDDYGTGNSNLESVLSLPISHLKIDQSFIRRGMDTEKGQIILRNIVELGNSLKVKMTAEGVETKEQRDYLETLGCASIQGYYYCKPLPQDELEQLFAQVK